MSGQAGEEVRPGRGAEHQSRAFGVLGAAVAALAPGKPGQHGDFDALAAVGAAVAALAPRSPDQLGGHRAVAHVHRNSFARLAIRAVLSFGASACLASSAKLVVKTASSSGFSR